MLSLKISSFTWVGPQFLQKNSKILLCAFVEEEEGPCFISEVLFLDCSSLFPYSFPSLINGYLNLPFGTQGRSKRLKERLSPSPRNRGYGKALQLRGPHSVLFHLSILKLHLCTFSQLPDKKRWSGLIQWCRIYLVFLEEMLVKRGSRMKENFPSDALCLGTHVTLLCHPE